MRKRSLLAICLVLAVSMMSACSSSSQVAPTSAAAAKSSQVPAPTKATEAKSVETKAAAATEAKSGSKKAYKIGIASREITNDYNRGIVTSAQSAIEAAGGTVVSTDAQADVQKHNENIENLINSGIDGLIVQLGDPKQLAPIMAKAKEKGIPVVTAGVGSPVENTITDINGDDALMATLASDALLSSIDYKGDVYIVWVPGAPLLETRKRIFEAICADYPDVKLHEVPTEHNPAKVQTQIEELMTANPDKGSIAGIFTTYDALMSGACSSIQKAGRGDEIKVVGIDGDIISFQMLFQKDGPFVASVVQDCNSIGKKAADIVIGVLDGTVDASSIKKKTSADSYVATRKNGIKAAEMKWTTNFWTDASLKKEDVEKDFPQSEDVMIEVPVLP